MPIPQFSCPDCGTLIVLLGAMSPHHRLRCRECGTTFAPGAASPEHVVSRESERARTPRRKRKRGRSRALHLVVLLGGAGLLAGVAAVMVVLVLVSESTRRAFGVNVKVTPDNARKLWVGMTLAEAEEILWRGQVCTPNEIADIATADHGPRRALMYAAAPPPGVDSWARWHNGGCQVFAGFRKSDSGVERLAYVQIMKLLPGDVLEHEELNAANPFFDLDAMAADHEKNVRLLQDPRWKSGPAIRTALVGQWRLPGMPAGDAWGYDFNADGSYVRLGLPGGGKGTGSHRFTDDSHIEIDLSEPDLFNPGRFFQARALPCPGG
jgi:hypothetical protein